MPERVERLNFFLLRETVREPKDALDDRKGLIASVPGFAFNAYLHIGPARSGEPGWVQFLKPGFGSQLPTNLRNGSTSAVLFFETKGRWFAIAFGRGRYLLNLDQVEPDFGLKVTLNAVDLDKLRTVDLRVLDDMLVTRRVQASRSAGSEVFGIDPSRDLLRAVTGKPRQESLGKRLTGADSLVLTAKVSLEGLAGKAQELLLFYGAKTYQDRFGWIDNVRRAPHEDLETLDRWLEESIRAGTADVAYLAPPSTLDWAHVDGFRYPGQKGDQPLEPDLDIDRCLEKWHGEPTIQILKRKKIEVYSNGATDEPNDAWSIYHALVFQGSRDGRLFLLVDGQWFEVAKSFAEEVSQRLGAIPRSPLALGPCPSNLGEGEYNAAVAKDSGGQLALMDKKLVKVAGGGDPIELCDLFSASGQFIHVKKRHASSTLSHLFAQGRIAGQSFLRDGDLREKARTHLKDAGPAYQDLIPLAGPVPASDFEVVFAIITKNADGLPGNLPFFSRLNLVNAAESLVADFGYRVSFAGIELAAPVDNKK